MMVRIQNIHLMTMTHARWKKSARFTKYGLKCFKDHIIYSSILLYIYSSVISYYLFHITILSIHLLYHLFISMFARMRQFRRKSGPTDVRVLESIQIFQILKIECDRNVGRSAPVITDADRFAIVGFIHSQSQ